MPTRRGTGFAGIPHGYRNSCLNLDNLGGLHEKAKVAGLYP